MSPRWIATIILVALAIGVMVFVRTLAGALIGSFFLIAMLFLWTLPTGAFARGSGRTDPRVKSLSRTMLGIGLGLLASLAAALLLPPRYFSWLIIGAGLALMIWVVIQWRRS